MLQKFLAHRFLRCASSAGLDSSLPRSNFLDKFAQRALEGCVLYAVFPMLFLVRPCKRRDDAWMERIQRPQFPQIVVLVGAGGNGWIVFQNAPVRAGAFE